MVKTVEAVTGAIEAVEPELVEGKAEVALAPAEQSGFGAVAGEEMEAIALRGSLWLAGSRA
jgi:hypothetical protein